MQGSEEMSAWRQNRMPKDGKVRKKRADGPRRPNPLTTNPAPREYSKSPLLETPQPAQQLVSPLMADNEDPAPARGPGAIYKHVLPQGQAPAAQQEGKYFMDPNKTVVKPSPLETGSGYYGRGGGGGSARPNQRPSSRPTSPESRAPGSSRSAPPRAGAGYGNYQPPAGGGRLGGNSPGYGSINQTPPNAAGRRTGRRRRGGSGDDAEGDLEEALREGALKEQADCRLETMTRVPTTLVLLAPYLAFALAMWLDTSTALQRTQLPLTLSDCSAPGLSCSLAPGGGGGGTTVWTAQVDGVPPAGSFLYLDAVFPSGSPALSDAAIASAKSGGAEGSTYYQMPLSVKVWGLDGSEATSASGSGDGTDDADSGGSDGAGGAGMGAVIYDAPEDTETFQCTATEEACAPVRVVDLLLNSPGAAGWYAGYTVALEYEDGLGDLFAGARFTLSYTSAFWADLTKYARAGALALALAAAVNWLVQNGAEPKERNTWLPERQYFTALLLFLLLWLNPWRCWAEWAGGRVPGDLRAWLLATDLAQGLGTQGLFLSALLVMDGLRFVKKKHRGPSYMDQLGLVSDVPPHHPCGDDACDFFWVKVAYFAAAAAATTACALARHWDLLDGRPKAAAAADEVDAVAGAYLALTALTLAFALGWLLWTLRATVRTGLVLRRRPFLDNRFQQLLYRVLSAQGALVGVALGVSYGVQIYGTFRYSLGNLNLALLPQVWLGQTGLETLWGSGPGQLLFLAVVAATLQYIMLPPDHSVRRANNRMFVAMERQLPRAALRQRRRPTLCLETALNLMEASWQVYYDHTGYSHNPIAPGRMELDELGLRLEAVFEDAAQDVRGFLARAEDPPRLVLAFRGTMTLKNVLTDLDLGQMLLYDVMEPPEELRGHGWGAEEDSEASYHSESDDDWGGSGRLRHRYSRGLRGQHRVLLLRHAPPGQRAVRPDVQQEGAPPLPGHGGRGRGPGPALLLLPAQRHARAGRRRLRGAGGGEPVHRGEDLRHQGPHEHQRPQPLPVPRLPRGRPRPGRAAGVPQQGPAAVEGEGRPGRRARVAPGRARWWGRARWEKPARGAGSLLQQRRQCLRGVLSEAVYK